MFVTVSLVITCYCVVSDLKKVHNDRLLLQFDNREGEKDREIDILTGFITQNFSLAGAKLKTILTKEKSNKLDPDSKIRKNIQRWVRSQGWGLVPHGLQRLHRPLATVRNRSRLSGPLLPSCSRCPRNFGRCKRPT